ncbi:MAG: hypothetical protein ACFCVB_10185 [Nodosilinea sp.]
MGSGKTFSNDHAGQPRLGLEAADSYECPMCRHGQIEQMAMMDTYACNFCRHIFDVNLAGQTVHVVDGLQPMVWRWQGRRWRPIYQGGSEVALTLWLVAGVLVIFPAGLVALGGYMFPPLVESIGAQNAGVNWSVAWAIGTLTAHGTMVGWLMAEHYQLPIYVLAKIRLQRFLARLPA